MLDDVQAQGMQEQVLPADRLVKVEASVASFGDDCLPGAVSLLQLLHLVHLLGVDEGFELALAVNLALVQEMPSERCQLPLLLVELALAKLNGFLQVVDLILCVLSIGLLLGLVPLQLNQVVREDLPDVRLVSSADARGRILALVHRRQLAFKYCQAVLTMVTGVNVRQMDLVLRHGIRLIARNKPELHKLITRALFLPLVEDDCGFADVPLVDRVRAQWTLFPSVLFLEIQVLKQARVAEKMAAFRDAGCDHEPGRLHANRTLRFLICRGLGRLRVHDLDHVLPLHGGAWVTQVLHVSLLLLAGDLRAFLGLLRSLLRRGVRRRADGVGLLELLVGRPERFQDVAERSLLDLVLGEDGLVVRDASVSSPLSRSHRLTSLILIRLIISLEAEQVTVVFDTGCARAHLPIIVHCKGNPTMAALSMLSFLVCGQPSTLRPLTVLLS